MEALDSHKIINRIYDVINNLCKIFLFVQVVVVSIVVFGRYIFNMTPAWGEELAIFCMVWFALLSVSIAIINRSHIKITITDYILPQKVNSILDKIVDYLVFILSIFLIIWGAKVTKLSCLSIMPGLQIKSGWLYASLPVSGLAMFIMNLGKVGGVKCQ